MKFGVFSVSMPEYGIEDSVKLLKEFSYDGVEWRVAEIPDEEPGDVPFEFRYWKGNKSTLDVKKIAAEAERVKTLCSDAGLEIFGLTTYLDTDQFDELTEVMKAAQAIGCPRVRVGLVNYDPDKATKTYPELFEDMRRDLARISELAGQYGVKAVVEIHMNTLISSPSAAYRALEGLDPKTVGVIFDPGNMVIEGFEEYRKSFELLGDFVAHVHIKNSRWIEDGRDDHGALRWKRDWAPLWEGMADLQRIFVVMEQLGYDGTVCIEDFSNDEPTYDKLSKDLVYIKKLKATAEQKVREAKEA